jgi:2-polyprenyl-6-methoxyphenol hydroxylase-like FAD-dependent oxidoreductase
MAMSRELPRIAIVGGGPAGLVAAIAARRAGFACTVYEQAESFERVGGAVGIQSNGLVVLEALGLLESFRDRIVFITSGVLESPPGRLVARADLTQLGIPHAGFAVALRYDLQEILCACALGEGVELRFGARCTRAEWLPHATRLHFADGISTDAPLVLACDGVNSVVRENLGFKSKKKTIREAYLRVVSPMAHPDLARTGEYWARDGSRAGAFPLTGNRTYVFCTVPIGRWREILAHGLAEWSQSWTAFGEPTLTLLRAVTDWQSAVYDELSDVRVERWQRNGVFLLGDAAHAMTPNLGQGANSAMVDGLLLVNLLQEAAPSRAWRDAGRRYEQLRRPFVTRIQNAALLGGRMAASKNPVARALRNGLLRLSSRLPSVFRTSMLLTAGYHPAELPYLRAPGLR